MKVFVHQRLHRDDRILSLPACEVLRLDAAFISDRARSIQMPFDVRKGKRCPATALQALARLPSPRSTPRSTLECAA